MKQHDTDTRRVVGKIKWFDPVKGFGFVIADEGGPDILLHANVLRNFGQSSVADAARVEIEDGEISLDELEAMEADLLESMPPVVAVHAAGMDPNGVDAELATATPPAHGPTSSGSQITERAAAIQTPTIP